MKKIKILSILIVVAILLVAIPALAQDGFFESSSILGKILMTPDWSFETNQAADISSYDHRQLMVSSGCDVNGDGFEDLIVGDRDYDYKYAKDDNGRVWLFLGSSTGLSSTPSLTFNPPYENYYGFFGTQVVCVGDVNKDGYEDFMVGMDNYDNTTQDEGAVFVYYGSPTGPSTTYSWMARGGSSYAYAHFGLGLDSAGDVNGDGYDDIIVGDWENQNNAVGHAYVWYGGSGGLGATGLPSNADWVATGPSGVAGNYFGLTTRGIGDVNGDNYDDILVAANKYDGAFADQGAVFVWYGSASGLGDPGTTANADWSATGGQVSALFGSGCDGVGDLNGDGYDDLAVGAYAYDNAIVNGGNVFVWYGSATGLGDAGTPANADWKAEGTGGNFGYVVRPAGDVNHDGFADLLTTAFSYSVPTDAGTLATAGAWFVWTGSLGGLGETGAPANADIAGYGDQVDARLGGDDAGSADTNHDGIDETYVAAYRYDRGQTDEGVVFGYYNYQRLFLPMLSR